MLSTHAWPSSNWICSSPAGGAAPLRCGPAAAVWRDPWHARHRGVRPQHLPRDLLRQRIALQLVGAVDGPEYAWIWCLRTARMCGRYLNSKGAMTEALDKAKKTFEPRSPLHRPQTIDLAMALKDLGSSRKRESAGLGTRNGMQQRADTPVRVSDVICLVVLARRAAFGVPAPPAQVAPERVSATRLLPSAQIQ